MSCYKLKVLTRFGHSKMAKRTLQLPLLIFYGIDYTPSLKIRISDVINDAEYDWWLPRDAL
jgi:hypothetical protein